MHIYVIIILLFRPVAVGEVLRHLLHYTNYFYPVTLDDHVSKKTKSSPLSSPIIHPMQRVAIDRVDYWIKTR